jgi:FkbM family methyltransferase
MTSRMQKFRETNFETMVPRFNFSDRIKASWLQYNDFTIKEIIKLIKCRLSGFVTEHCAYCILAQKLLDKPVKTIIDVGAHNGAYARSAKYILPKAKVYAFEPTEIYREIGGKDIHGFNFALWNKTDTGIFYKTFNVNTHRPGCNSSFFRNKATDKYAELDNQKVKEISIERKRFDDLDITIERPCLVKIDVEGSEFEVLKGFGDKLKSVDIIQLEYIFEEVYNRKNFIKIISLLDKYGFGFIQPMITWYKNKPCSNDLLFFRRHKVN